MQNDTKTDGVESSEMTRHRLYSPSPELRQRVLRSAREAWSQEDAANDIPWGFPVLRFAASLAIAALLITSANMAGDRTVAKWKDSSRITSTREYAAMPGFAAVAAKRNAPERMGARLSELHSLLGLKDGC